MINVKEVITVGQFIELIKPFSDMEITFTKINSSCYPTDFNCDCGINLTSNQDNMKLEIKLDK